MYWWRSSLTLAYVVWRHSQGGAYYQFTVDVKERFEPFGISRRTADSGLATPRRAPGLLAGTGNLDSIGKEEGR